MSDGTEQTLDARQVMDALVASMQGKHTHLASWLGIDGEYVLGYGAALAELKYLRSKYDLLGKL